MSKSNKLLQKFPLSDKLRISMSVWKTVLNLPVTAQGPTSSILFSVINEEEDLKSKVGAGKNQEKEKKSEKISRVGTEVVKVTDNSSSRTKWSSHSIELIIHVEKDGNFEILNLNMIIIDEVVMV